MILLCVALAYEPLLVSEFRLGPTGGPPATECGGPTAAVAPAGGRNPPPTPSAVPAPSVPLLRYDLAPDATNDHLGPDDLARLQLPGPYDLTRLPDEPLRGAPADVRRVQSVVAAAERGGKRVRLAFWGASHVAGEYWTGELRRMLQDRGGDGGHGYVMPAAPWKGYRGTDVNLCTGGPWASDYDRREGGRQDGKYGPAGLSIESSDPAAFGWVQTTRTNPHGRAVSRFEVMYYRQPGGGNLLLTVDDASAIRVPTGAEAAGPGLAVLHLPDGPHRLVAAPAGDGPVRLFGVHMERDEGVGVDAMGVSGRTASSWQRWDPGLIAPYLDRRPPDLAVLAYGTNEANDGSLTEEGYRQSLGETLSRFRALLPDAACLLVGPSDRGKKESGTLHYAWPRTEWVARVQREVGPSYGCATWDLQAATGGLGSVFRWRLLSPPLMAPDLIHFTAEGYKEVARRMYRALSTAP